MGDFIIGNVLRYRYTHTHTHTYRLSRTNTKLIHVHNIGKHMRGRKTPFELARIECERRIHDEELHERGCSRRASTWHARRIHMDENRWHGNYLLPVVVVCSRICVYVCVLQHFYGNRSDTHTKATAEIMARTRAKQGADGKSETKKAQLRTRLHRSHNAPVASRSHTTARTFGLFALCMQIWSVSSCSAFEPEKFANKIRGFELRQKTFNKW